MVPLNTSETKRFFRRGSKARKDTISVTFHLETLRMVAFINFVITLLVCSLLTKYYVDVEPEDTEIYRIFGFNHACNVVDHHPAREVGSILILFFILPLAIFHFLSHYRTRRAVEEGRVPPWLLTFSSIVSPYNFLATCWCYMWFVNNPDDTYGFIGHYIPYLAYQVMMALMAFHQVFYLVHSSSSSSSSSSNSSSTTISCLPWEVRKETALGYAIFLALLTTVYTAYVVSILAGSPIWDSVNNDNDRLFAQIMAKLYSLCTLFLPIVFAAIERKNGDLHTISFG